MTGDILSGTSNVTAQYQIDNDPPDVRTVPLIDAATVPIFGKPLYGSPNLPLANHTLTIEILAAGGDRNYSVNSFIVQTSGVAATPNSSNTSNGNTRGTSAADIVGYVAAGIAVVILVVFLIMLRKFLKTSKQLSEALSMRKPEMSGHPVEDKPAPGQLHFASSRKLRSNGRPKRNITPCHPSKALRLLTCDPGCGQRLMKLT